MYVRMHLKLLGHLYLSLVFFCVFVALQTSKDPLHADSVSLLIALSLRQYLETQPNDSAYGVLHHLKSK